ncbi:YlbF family regulator [Salicibibacter kimchii]|uniref:YlbF family regulator n=1 Tax=Salicibibacter kimchii TaxID=2099786 RepID=A0A345BX17_9BACI|nr:YlbF family regulator [Salicibibacter kimchii]AXF55498.1 YlbF family regulator [Salicibibacter kimchii]
MQTVVSTPIELLDASEELSKMIRSSDIYHHYVEARRNMLEDEEAKRLIEAFNHHKVKFDEVQRFGKYHPDYSEVTKTLRIAKREMDLHESVSTYKRAERDLEKLLTEVSEVLATSVSPNIKVPSNNPYFDNSSCSGGCGSGGSCSC